MFKKKSFLGEKKKESYTNLFFPLSSFTIFFAIKNFVWGFPGGAVVENLPANAGDTGSSPGLGGSHMPQLRVHML